MAILIDPKELDGWAADAAQLVNLLTTSGSQLELNESWFAHPWVDGTTENIKGIPNRPQPLLDLLADFLGDAATDTPSGDFDWYPVKKDGDPTGLYIVMSKDHTTDPALIGVGLWKQFQQDDVKITTYLSFPLFSLSKSGPTFVLGKSGTPVEVVGEVSSKTSFTTGGKKFATLQIKGSIYFDATVPGLAVNFLADDGSTVDAFKTLDDLLKGSATDWINFVLGVSFVESWLNKAIGTSTETPGQVLTTLGLLAGGGAGPAAAAAGGGFKVGDLTAFQSKTPLEHVEDLVFLALSILASMDKPLIPVGNGGIYVTQKGKAEYYGIRVCLPDVGKTTGKGAESKAGGNGAGKAGDNGAATAKQNKPQFTLQVGKWFTGEDKNDNSWLKRADTKYDGADPGISVYLIEKNGSVAFKPRLELVSVGFDYVGGNAQPLVDVKGFTLGGIEPRAYVALDFSDPGAVVYGGGIRLDKIGVPLGTQFDKVGGDNPVASNLLTSGDTSKPDAGGDAAKGKKDAINPAFSISGSYIDRVSVQLYGPDDAETDTVWFPLQRAFGPLTCQKVGVGWKDADRILSLLFDGSVALAGLEVDLMGLSIGVPVEHPGTLSGYELGLDGLAVEFKGGPVEISGALLENKAVTPVAYDGEAFIKVESFGIGAFGSYTTVDGQPSLFIFAVVDYPLGDPTGTGAFFVTGLAAGFGYNRGLKLPTQDQVLDFPLVAGLSDPSKLGGPDASPGTALAKLDKWVPPQRGEYWLAAGLKFTTFEIVTSNALIVVEFGKEFEAALLGLSIIKLPQTGTSYAYAELELAVVIKPDEGTFQASLVLSPNSYVIDPKCQLTGGFAFYTWFGDNPHAGDFVVTLGGYHPAFQVPAWYPAEPRLGFNWPVSDNVTIKGGAYFALTPSAVMAGGSLEALYHSGNLKAWFTAYANVIIYWKPFFFDADIGISIGASYRVHLLFITKTFKIELSAALEIWGPPTGGKVHIHWFIISFTVGFGASRDDIDRLVDWDSFTELLPKGDVSQDAEAPKAIGAASAGSNPVVLSIIQQGGVFKQTNAGSAKRWHVRPDEFRFTTNSNLPSTEADLINPAGDTKGAPVKLTQTNAGVAGTVTFGVRPVGIAQVTSAVHSVEIQGDDGNRPPKTPAMSFDLWNYDLSLGGRPEAMYGPPISTSKMTPSAKLIDNCIVGVKDIQHQPHPALTGPPEIDAETAFTYVPVAKEGTVFLPFSTSVAPPTTGGPTPSETTLGVIGSTITQVKAGRANVFQALAALGSDAQTDGDLSVMAAQAAADFEASPMFGAPQAS